MRTAMNARFLHIPAGFVSPERVLKLVLDIKQPDSDRAAEQCDR